MRRQASKHVYGVEDGLSSSLDRYFTSYSLIQGTVVAKKRRGMLIKNTNDRPVSIQMSTRPITLNPGEEKFITSEEVLDPTLREHLQVRAVSIVRPSTEEEDDALHEEIQDYLSQAEPEEEA